MWDSGRDSGWSIIMEPSSRALSRAEVATQRRWVKQPPIQRPQKDSQGPLSPGTHDDCVIRSKPHSPLTFLPRWRESSASPFSRYLREHTRALDARPAGREAAITTAGRKEKVPFLFATHTLTPAPRGHLELWGRAGWPRPSQACSYSGSGS